MRGVTLTGNEIAGHIREAGETCLLIAPGVDETVREALLDRAKRTAAKATVVIDGEHHAERSGYGETRVWRHLMDATELMKMPGTRLGLLITTRGIWLFAPRAGNLDPREGEGLSAVKLDEAHRKAGLALFERILGRRVPDFPVSEDADDQPASTVDGRDKGEPGSEPVTNSDLDEAEKAIEEHPPRDYAKESEITVYTAFVGYIQMRLVGASLATGVQLTVPSELVERGLSGNTVRERIRESVRIDLEEEVDTGVGEINERLKAILKLYTRQLGEPHGRIYRKRQRKELDAHFDDLRKEIERANSTLAGKIEAVVRKRIDELVETYTSQTANDAAPKITREEAGRLLNDAWRKAGGTRRRTVKLEVTYKDLTWETLQDQHLRARIVEGFPDLRDSWLYRETVAHVVKT